MSLNGTYNVTHSNDTVGTLSVSSDGLRTVFILESDVTPEISRLICTNGSQSISVGIPVPVGDKMRLNKTFTKSQLKTAGLNCITEAVLVPLSVSAKPSYSNVPSEIRSLTATPTSVEPTDAPEESPCESYPDGWKSENNPSSLFKNEFIAEICKNISGALSKDENGNVSLAIPVSESEMFPLTSFLCFGKPIEICGEKYICFTVKNGDLV